MLKWFTGNVRDHGVAEAVKLLVRSYGSRAVNVLANSSLPAKVACPCCGWEGRRFFDYYEVGRSEKGVECPNCHSHGRHRAFYLWLENDFRLSEKTGIALICAPEEALTPLWTSVSGLKIVGSDISPNRNVDVLADIQRLPFAENSVDMIWCHHILEQVPDDSAAMSELFRVLRPLTGNLVVSSGMSLSTATVEYAKPNATEYGNWRLYGQDFPNRLASAGFELNRIRYRWTSEEAKRFGIDVEEKAFICSKSM